MKMIGNRLSGTIKRVRAGVARRLGRSGGTAFLQPPPSRLNERPDLQIYDIGRYSWGHLTVPYRTAGASLRIGQFSSFAYGCVVVLGGEHHTEFVSMFRFPLHDPFKASHGHLKDDTVLARGDVSIGNDVWVGQQVMILSGVTIGNGAVVGSGSVVRQSIPPFAIALGNPARVAGYRFPAEQIEALERISWWDWPDEKLISSMDQLLSNDIEGFIQEFDPELK